MKKNYVIYLSYTPDPFPPSKPTLHYIIGHPPRGNHLV